MEKCDFCEAAAVADGKTKMGPWAYMCERHLKQNGYPKSKGLTNYFNKENGGKDYE